MISIVFDIRHFVLSVQAETQIYQSTDLVSMEKEKHLHKMVWQKMVGTRVGYATTLWWKCSTQLIKQLGGTRF